MGVYYFECGIDGGFEKEHSSGDPRNPCPLCRIAELEAENKGHRLRIAELEGWEELEVANEIGARHAKRVGEQAIELQALREAAEELIRHSPLEDGDYLWTQEYEKAKRELQKVLKGE
jgi:hypothetical protein